MLHCCMKKRSKWKYGVREAGDAEVEFLSSE
jgi:hypothetical protein